MCRIVWWGTGFSIPCISCGPVSATLCSLAGKWPRRRPIWWRGDWTSWDWKNGKKPDRVRHLWRVWWLRGGSRQSRSLRTQCHTRTWEWWGSMSSRRCSRICLPQWRERPPTRAHSLSAAFNPAGWQWSQKRWAAGWSASHCRLLSGLNFRRPLTMYRRRLTRRPELQLGVSGTPRKACSPVGCVSLQLLSLSRSAVAGSTPLRLPARDPAPSRCLGLMPESPSSSKTGRFPLILKPRKSGSDSRPNRWTGWSPYTSVSSGCLWTDWVYRLQGKF